MILELNNIYEEYKDNRIGGCNMTVSPYDNLPVKGREPKPLEYVEVPMEDLVETSASVADNASPDASANAPAGISAETSCK